MGFYLNKRIQMFLSLFIFVGGIVEAAMAGRYCSQRKYKNYYGHESYYSYDCYSNRTIGQGIWCSIFPFIAGIFGIVCSSKSATKKQNGLLIGFSVTGAVFLGIMFISELILLGDRSRSYRSLQIALASTTGVNLILLIISASYGCCFACCYTSNQSQRHIAYIPNGSTPVQFSTQTMVNNPQMGPMSANPQMVFMPTNTQMISMPSNSQVNNLNPSNMQPLSNLQNPVMFVQPQMAQVQIQQQTQQPQMAQESQQQIQQQQVQQQQIEQSQSSVEEPPKYHQTENKVAL